MVSEQYEKGMEILDGMTGGNKKMVTDSLEAIEALAPGLSRTIVECAYGDIYGRPGLDLKSREIAAIAALSVIGSGPQLLDHILTGMSLGLTKDEIREIIVEMIVFAGFPAALTALEVARDAFGIWDSAMEAGSQ